MAKEQFTMRINPEIKFYAKQVAQYYDRDLTYMIESLLLQAINEARQNGLKLEKFIPPGGEVIGRGKDVVLQEKFQKFIQLA